jgi:hypothetical protein
MAWIESHQSLERHPKTLDLMTRMGWDLDTTIGKLQRFWWWCVDYAEDGDLQKHNDGRLGGAVGLNGEEAKAFKVAMVEACWLDRDPYFRVHDWWNYIGRFLQVKYKHYPDKWQHVRAAYLTNKELKNGSSNGLNNHRTNQPKQPTNQPEYGFDEFWLAWPQKSPRKVNRKGCFAHWKSADLCDLVPLILAGLARWKRSVDWTKNDGQYIPPAAHLASPRTLDR